MTNTKRMDVKKLAVLAMFAALAYLCLFFRIKIQFLTLDIKDVFITVSAFLYGPLAGLAIALVEALIEMITLSDTGFWGCIMNFAGSAAFAVSAGLVYKYKRSLLGAAAGLVTAVISMTAVMIVMNILITPLYIKTSVDYVYTLIPTLLLPFNLLKGLLNAGLIYLLYKPLSRALKKMGLLTESPQAERNVKRTVIVSAAALIVIALSITLLFVCMNGKVEWFS